MNFDKHIQIVAMAIATGDMVDSAGHPDLRSSSPGRPRNSAARAAEDPVRDRIVVAAATLFKAQGFSGTSMRHIAKTLGMKSGSLYYHFDSKDDILDAVLDRGLRQTIDRFNQALADLPKGADFPTRLRAAVIVHLSCAHDLSVYASEPAQHSSQLPETVLRRHASRREAYGTLWRELLLSGVDEGAIAPFAHEAVIRLLLLGALNWSTEWLDSSRKSCEEIGELATDFFLAGLKAAS